MSVPISFSVSDEIKAFADYYSDLRLTTPSAMGKKGMIAEMIRHPLQQAQIEEYEKRYGPVPQACLSARCRTGTAHISSSLNSLKTKDSSEDKDNKEIYAEGVRMTKTEYSALVGQYGEAVVKLAIEKVAAQQIKTGKSYKSPRGAILQWGIRAALEEQEKHGKPIDRSPAPHPVCDLCGKVCERGVGGYWDCPDPAHGRREAVL
jgi:hypothetical protein